MPPTTRKARSGNPAVRAAAETQQDDGRYVATSWGNGGAGELVDLEVPSGQLCLCRRPGIEGLMKAGILRNVDSLSHIVSEKHIKRVEGKETLDIKSLDDKAVETITDTVDKVIEFAVVKPQVWRPPNDVTLRQPGRVYTDMIDMIDKMFIFNFVVGGTRDLESFRREFDELLGSVEAGEDLPVQA